LSQDRIVGYTTGVFDMFHVGHLRILKQAKSQCDHLIVGVSSDALVQSYKNKTPIIPLTDRMEILQSIKFVDEVIVQEHRDKFRAFKEIGFNRMFVGDDWKGKAVFQEAERKLSNEGVDVVYFPYTTHVSSTRLTEVLQDLEQGQAD